MLATFVIMITITCTLAHTRTRTHKQNYVNHFVLFGVFVGLFFIQ